MDTTRIACARCVEDGNARPAEISKQDMAGEPILEREVSLLKINAISKPKVDGRVMIGPKKVRGGYARIVSCKDGSGSIESFDSSSGTWTAAEQSLTFAEVWSALPVTPQDWADLSGKF